MDSIAMDGRTMPLTQNLMWYAGKEQGNTGNRVDDRPSGAYVFRPNDTDATLIANQATLTVHKGKSNQSQFNPKYK